MAFDIRNFSRASAASNTGVIEYEGVDINGPAIFSYQSSVDTVAEIVAADYFAAAVYELAIKDLIWIVGTDGTTLYQVDSIDRLSATVTLVTVSSLALVGTANIQDDAVTTVKLDDDAVTNAKLADDAVSLENLDDGIAPSHVVKYADSVTSTGGNATEAFTVTGALATDLPQVTMVDNGSNDVAVLQAAVSADTLTVTFDADPGNDAIISYSLLRASA